MHLCHHSRVETNTFGRQLIFTTVRIRTILADGRQVSGTGFIYNANRFDIPTPVIITNKHVVEGADSGFFSFIAAEGDGPRLGDAVEVTYTDFQKGWIGHPREDIDVTCMLLAPTLIQADEAGRKVFFKSIGPNLCPTNEVLTDLDAVEEVTFVGYPNALYDTANLTPITRRGITATPIELNYRGLPTFLIDAAAVPGSSGSPVFVTQRNGYMEGNTFRVGGFRAFFVGIVASAHVRAESGELVFPTSGPLVRFDQLLDLGVVFNWHAVEETVDALCQQFGIDRNQRNAPQIEAT